MGDLDDLVRLMKEKNFRKARSLLRSILKGKSYIYLFDEDFHCERTQSFLMTNFNKSADKMNASFWKVDGSMPSFNPNKYKFELLSDEEAEKLAIRSNKVISYGLRDAVDIPFIWDKGRYPKLQTLNKMAEEGDLTDEEEKAYSEAARKFYGVGEWVENIPQDEMWLGSGGW